MGGEGCTRGFPVVAGGLGNFPEYDVIDGVCPRISNSGRRFKKYMARTRNFIESQRIYRLGANFSKSQGHFAKYDVTRGERGCICGFPLVAEGLGNLPKYDLIDSGAGERVYSRISNRGRRSDSRGQASVKTWNVRFSYRTAIDPIISNDSVLISKHSKSMLRAHFFVPFASCLSSSWDILIIIISALCTQDESL